MEPKQAVVRETGYIALGTAALGALMLVLFAAAGYFDWRVLLGAAYGSVLAVGNFYFLGMTVRKIAETVDARDAEGIKHAAQRMRKSYMLRMAAGAGLLVLALGIFRLNWIACLAPLLFPRMTIFFVDLHSRIKRTRGK